MASFEELYRLAIEVDQDRSRPNREAQRVFLAEFGARLYVAADTEGPLHHLRHIYFTRIHAPDRDKIGSYVRLHFFVDEEHYAAARAAIDGLLKEFQDRGRIFQVLDQPTNGISEASIKGAERFPEQYYAFVEHISRTVVALMSNGVADDELDRILWPWTHNLFNLVRGYQVPVLTIDPRMVLQI